MPIEGPSNYALHMALMKMIQKKWPLPPIKCWENKNDWPGKLEIGAPVAIRSRQVRCTDCW